MVRTGRNDVGVGSDHFRRGHANSVGRCDCNGYLCTCGLDGTRVASAAFGGGAVTPMRGHAGHNNTLCFRNYAATSITDYAFAGGVYTVANGMN